MWQGALHTLLEAWKTRIGAHDRIPADWERARRERPDESVLVQAGFELAGSRRFTAEHAWTPDALIGFVYSTSFLPRAVLGEQAQAFEQELRHELGRAGKLRETIEFAYALARKPRSPSPSP